MITARETRVRFVAPQLRPANYYYACVSIRSESALTHAMNTYQDAFFFDGGRDFFYSIDALAFTRDIIVAVSLFLRRVQRRFS